MPMVAKAQLELSWNPFLPDSSPGENMSTPSIECLEPDAPHEKLIEVLDRDGVAMVEAALWNG